MRKLFLALVATTACVSVAHAGDKPILVPAPDWVKPVAAMPADPKGDGAPMRILLSDQQIRVEPGRQTVYNNVAFQIQSPAGLAAGNISFPWRPDVDELRVHKLLIRRGDKVIDVLASGQTFTVARRETNLESATLDGVLTANIQPEGLQVGDILEFAVSISSSDPTLKNHVEQVAAIWNGVPFARGHLRVEWPNAVPLRFQASGGLPAPKPVRSGDRSVLDFTLDRIEPISAPKGAPLRYSLGRMVEFTDFASWAEPAALLAPLYAKAATVSADSPLRKEIERIRAATPDPKARAEAALALVQDRVRYVALQMGVGGLTPADAETSWARRYGDCKAKVALLLAILHALDIAADPVAVSTVAGDMVEGRLPMVGLFNHVIVRAQIAGRTYWLDGTRTGDASLDRIAVPSFGWGLPLLAQGAALVPIVPPPLALPGSDTMIRMDATAGISIPAPTTVETVLRGDDGIGINLMLANLTGDARDRTLRDYWRGRYDFIDIDSVSATFDAAAGEMRLGMKGKARMDWSSDYYETDDTGVGYKADFHRDPGPNQDAPYAVSYPSFSKSVETILLPPSFAGMKPDSDWEVDRTIAGVAYRRHATITGSTISFETTERSIAREFPAKDAPAAQAALRELAGRTAYIAKPDHYRPTEAEFAAAAASTPLDADGFLKRGNMYLDRSQYPLAIKDFESVLALEPKNVWALANRGITRVWAGDQAGAAKDLEAAAAIDPENPVIMRARGLMAEKNGDWKAAIAAYDRALGVDKNDRFALSHRLGAYQRIGDNDGVLRDSAAVLRLNPKWIDGYLMRANALRSQGKLDAVAAEAAAAANADPDNSFAHIVAANIYVAIQKRDEAMREYDRALAIKPDAMVYINRALRRLPADVAGRRADIDAALKLDPTMADALAAKADLQAEQGDRAGAIQTYSTAIAGEPEAWALINKRGILYARAGDMARATKDFAAARAKVSEAPQLNSLCWAKATAGVGLDSALGDCDAALAKAPNNAAYLDSRALVLLRLGRIAEAEAEYGRALAGNPNSASSLFGRAVTRARKGDKAGSDADAASALKIDPDIRASYEGYGLKL